MGLGKTFTVLAAALFVKTTAHSFISNKEYPLSFVFQSTFHQWQVEVEKGFAALFEVPRGWYPGTHPQPVPGHLQQVLHEGMATQDITPWHLVLFVVLPSVPETFVAVTRTITYCTHRAI